MFNNKKWPHLPVEKDVIEDKIKEVLDIEVARALMEAKADVRRTCNGRTSKPH